MNKIKNLQEIWKNLSFLIPWIQSKGINSEIDRGKPLNQRPTIDPELRACLLALVGSGVIEWNGEQLPPIYPVAINRSDKLVSDLVLEDRD